MAVLFGVVVAAQISGVICCIFEILCKVFAGLACATAVKSTLFFVIPCDKVRADFSAEVDRSF